MFFRTFFICSVIFLSTLAAGHGQSEQPVKWDFDVQKVSDTEIELKATATMKPGWVIYSQFTEEGGPIPTRFEVDGQPVVLEELPKAITQFDEMFDMKVSKLKEKAAFTIRMKATPGRTLRGTVEFMTCDGARCLPPKEIVFEKRY